MVRGIPAVLLCLTLPCASVAGEVERPGVGDLVPDLGLEVLLQAPEGASADWEALRGTNGVERPVPSLQNTSYRTRKARLCGLFAAAYGRPIGMKSRTAAGPMQESAVPARGRNGAPCSQRTGRSVP